MKNSLVWFRNDLRTQDNTSLLRACEGDRVVAVYCFDPRHYGKTEYGFAKTGKYRAKFLLGSVANLRKNLLEINIPLLIFEGKPETALPKVVREFSITHLYFQREWTYEEQLVADALTGNLPSSIEIVETYDQFLFHPADVPYDDLSEIPRVFTEFRKKCEKYGNIQQPLPLPEARPGEPLDTGQFSTQIPTLKALGHEVFEIDSRSAVPFDGGEDAAWQRLNDYFWNTKKLRHYKRTRNGLLGTDYSSKFSPWLANGSLSPRSIYAQVKKFEAEIEKNEDTYWLLFELIWRDFFKYVSLKHGNRLFLLDGILQKTYSWQYNDAAVQNWINGNTPYDFVNANMKEIAETGFMSNRGRQNVASYFAKELQQDWRIGASYFESMLIDYDVHSNWGNWQYVSGVGNDPRDRKFNIESQTQRYDPDGNYVAIWLPEVKTSK
ncbi:MAG: deoxyribodipyrimidine photolyase [Flavobacteriaceae bacterium]|nr:deoxyribodipyrimidine photolyase [Flavobacteriaceae bacterium]